MTPHPPPLLVSHVSRWFGDVVAVNDVSFSVGAGITGLLGPNGAGKTTVLKMLAGLQVKTQPPPVLAAECRAQPPYLSQSGAPVARPAAVMCHGYDHRSIGLKLVHEAERKAPEDHVERRARTV
jgi:ATPase subunit of ABC transporter with duplicated ATPase domains